VRAFMAQRHATFNDIIAHYFPGTQRQHVPTSELADAK
jgi:hypothetical protein